MAAGLGSSAVPMVAALTSYHCQSTLRPPPGVPDGADGRACMVSMEAGLGPVQAGCAQLGVWDEVVGRWDALRWVCGMGLWVGGEWCLGAGEGGAGMVGW